jgi:uncharacterized protein YkwD
MLCLCCSVARSAIAFQAREGNAGEANAGPVLQPTSAENELYNLVSEERKRHNLPMFVLDPHLVAAARKHSEGMATARKLSHQLPVEPELKVRLAHAGARFDAVAENVAHSESAENAHTELMNSPGHRANLLNPAYDAIGIGVVEKGQMIYVTEDFSHRVPDQTAVDVESQILKSVNQLRSRRGLPALQRTGSSSLRRVACKPGVTAADARRYIAGGGFLVVFTQSDAADPPNELKKFAVSPTVGTIEVGACYPPESKQGFALFTAVVVLSK